jgi:mannosyltransferase
LAAVQHAAPPAQRAPEGGKSVSWSLQPDRRRELRLRLAALASSPAGIAAGLIALLALSAALRLEAQGQWYWIDEGLSDGIASHSLTDIPGLLRQDGSPPLYYLLFHAWIGVFGHGEGAGHAFSLVFALATVPAAFWGGWSLFGRKAGWICAALAATNPFLTYYGREARMYTMVALLALLATVSFLHAFAFGRRRHLPLLALWTVLLLYTHNWALFFLIGAAVALVPCLMATHDRRSMVRDAIVVFGAAGVLYLPWIPTLLYQVAHTGAPWSRAPTAREAVSELSAVLGDERVLVALLLVGGAGLSGLATRRRLPQSVAVLGAVALVAVPLGVSWVTSQFEPNWATRYFAMIVGPVLLVAAAGLARAGIQGVAALVLILLFWTQPLGRVTGLKDETPAHQKSNVKTVTAAFAPRLHPGDLVVVTHPEQVPVVRYYFGDGLRYATPMGGVAFSSRSTPLAGADRARAHRRPAAPAGS